MTKLVSLVLLLTSINLYASYSRQYTGQTFKESERDLCQSHLETLVGKAESFGLKVTEGTCESYGKSLRVSFNYFYDFGEKLETRKYSMASKELCFLEEARVRGTFSSKGFKHFDSYCAGSKLVLEVFSNKYFLRDFNVYSSFSTFEACMNYTLDLEKKVVAKDIEVAGSVCEKKYGGKFSPSIAYAGKTLSQMRGDLVKEDECVLTTGDVEGDFLKAGLEVLSRSCAPGQVKEMAQETIVYIKPYTKNVDTYKGLNYATKQECESSLNDVLDVLSSEKKATIYSFCDSLYGGKFAPTVYYVK